MPNGLAYVADDSPINNQYQKLLNMTKNSAQFSGTDVPDQKHKYPGTMGSSKGVMHSGLMTFTQMLESMDGVIRFIESQNEDLMNETMEDEAAPPAPVTDIGQSSSTVDDDDDLLEQLNKLFTPVLVMQEFEHDISDKVQAAMSEAAVFTERNVIQFDDANRMAQLISVCAKLIAKKKNTEKYQMYAKAHKIKQQMALDIQKEEYGAAKALAQKYLAKVSTNNNSVVKDAAKKLMAEDPALTT